jgi:hypothetical protein
LSASAPIVLTCDAGIAVVLLASTELAEELGTAAEELLATGAQVELVIGIERAPARLVEAAQRARTPTLFVVYHRGAVASARTLRALFDQVASPQQRWLDCDLGDGAAAAGVRRIVAALAELSDGRPDREPSVPCDTAIDALFDDISHRNENTTAPAQEVSGVVALPEPRLLPQPAATAERRHRKTKALVLAGLAAASVAVLMIASARSQPDTAAGLEHRSGAVERPTAVMAAPEISMAPRPPQPMSAPMPIPVPAPTSIAIPVPVPMPMIEAREEPVKMGGDHRTQLDLAVAEPIMGERPWQEAMTTCRARPFWHVRGWRVPTRKELVELARAGVLPQTRVWSSTRGDRRSATSFVVDGHDATVSAEPRTEATAVTICVKRR